MTELKLCPVCGGKPYACSDYFRVWYVIACDCGHCTDEFRTEKEAIEAWNRRASNDGTD